jgi:hypothetical protein
MLAGFAVTAANISEVTGNGNNDWNSSTPWGAVPTSGNNYITTTAAGGASPTAYYGVTNILGRIRINNNNSVFSGGSLTVSTGTEVLLKGVANNASVYESADWIITGGIIRWAQNGVSGVSTNVLQGTLNVTANSYLVQGRLSGYGASWFDIATTVTGSGGLTLLSGSQNDYASPVTGLTFQFTGDLSAYTGVITLGSPTLTGEVLELNPANVNMAGVGISITNTDSSTTVILDEGITVGTFAVGPNVVGAGTYTAGQLNALGYGASFAGAGSLTVNSGANNLPIPTVPVVLPTNSVPAGAMVSFTEIMLPSSGPPPYTYQWQSNGVSIGTSVITNSTTNAIQLDTTGFAVGAYNYLVVVTNSSGAVTSAPVTLNIILSVPPTVTQGTVPAANTVYVGGSATFTATFSGTAPVAYQWEWTTNHSTYVYVPGATGTTLTLNNLQLTNAGYYSLWASNAATGNYTASSGDAKLTVLAGSPPSQLTISNSMGLAVTISANGNYTITSISPAWTFGGGVGTLSNPYTNSGADNIGAYTEIGFGFSNSVAQLGGIRLYGNQPVVLFTESTLASTPNGNFSLPTVTNSQAGLYEGGFAGMFGIFGISAYDQESPWLFFDANDNAFIISSATNYMIASSQHSGSTISCGINSAITVLPAGFTHRAILVVQNGINNAFTTWGNALTGLSNKTRPANDAAVELNTLGYWTDHGAVYYYNYVGTYLSTLQAMKAEFVGKGLQVGYMQLDSWWYPKGSSQSWSDNGDGMYLYVAVPALFPNGLASFQQQLGLPLMTHTRWIDPSSPYRSEYAMSGNVSVDPAFWTNIMSYIKSGGVATFEQDWLNGNAVPNMNLTDPPNFANYMAAAASSNGLNMEYCMETPRYYLQSSLYNNLMTIRVSNDRFQGAYWDQAIYDSRLASAVGTYPWVDVYMSTELRNLLISTLSAGGVGVGDAEGALSAANLSKAARADGVIVKPDVPLVPIDQTYINDAQGKVLPMIASTYSDFSGFRANYVFAYARSASNTNGSFAPSTLGAAGRVYVYDYFGQTGSVINATNLYSFNTSLSNDNSGGSYYVVVPVGPSGIAVLGDTNKFVTWGKKRIVALTDNGRLQMTVAFAAGESNVTITGYSPVAPSATVLSGTTGTVAYNPVNHLFTMSMSPGNQGTATVALSLNVQLGFNFQPGGNLILNWPLGNLLQATNLLGPWTTNSGTSPYTNLPVAPQMYYRVQVQ